MRRLKICQWSSTKLRVWNGAVTVDRIAGKKITVVPILRAGIGMLDGFLNLIPSAKVSVLGLERDEENFRSAYLLQKISTRCTKSYRDDY